MSELHIRAMRPDEISIAVEWAAAEGWNPGLRDAACFAALDPRGFLVGELGGAPAATISCVNYHSSFSFLGFYIVRAGVRGRGYGVRMWNEAIAHAGPRVIGIDGVVAQQQNYARSGFKLAYANIRYSGTACALCPRHADVVALGEVPFAAVEASDAAVFRPAFLRAWIDSPGHVGRAIVRNGRLAAWGVIRPCRRGYKIGPLVPEDCTATEAVASDLMTATSAKEVFIDVPSVNPKAGTFVQRLGLVPVFETARMYTGAILPVPVRALMARASSGGVGARAARSRRILIRSPR